MSLKEYARKRDFKKTAEPKAGRAAATATHRFVIQKHAASRLHYDFRLELGGTLKSWAVPKGVPYKKGERRLAVQVEDHPIGYIDFEGTIPQGQYGGGTVMVWDRGTFEPLSEEPERELAGGKLHFILRGEKLEGEWYLVQLRGGQEWLLIKGGKDMKPVTRPADDTSVASGMSMEEITHAQGRVWGSHRASTRAQEDDGVTAPVTRSAAKKTRRGARTSGATDVAKHSRAAAPAAEKKRKRASPKAVASPPTRFRSAARNVSRSASPRSLPFVEPMKALLVEQPPAGDWVYEIKFDGFRALAFRDQGGTRLLSRNNKDLAGKFPEVNDAITALEVSDALLDGEIVALDEQGRSSFQLLQAYDLGQQRPPICFFAFDLLQLNGRDLRALPLTERKAELAALLESAPPGLRFSATLGSEPGPLLEQARKLGLEGLIGKRPDSRYEVGQRSGAWIKLKLHHEQEFVIGGYTPPGGARQHFGAILVGVYERGQLKFAGKVGTGFNTALLRTLHARFERLASDTCPFVDLPEKRGGRYSQGITPAEMRRCHWVRPDLVAQIKFAEWTRDDRLRQPVFLGLREDKTATDVVREQR